MSSSILDATQPGDLIKMMRIRPSTARSNKLRQRDLADRIGVDPRTIQQWESGERLPSAHNLQRLIQVMIAEKLFLQGSEREEALMLWQSVKKAYDDIKEINALLRQSRLVTLAGAGGSGKTSLALHLASSLVDSYPGGIWVFEFASVSDPELVVPYMISAFGLEDRPDCPPLQSIIDFIQDQKMLFIFDNCEHVIQASAAAAETLLAHSSALDILATSQEPLNLPGENRYQVAAMQTPPVEETSFERLIEFESVQLFVERARMLNSHFQIDGQQILLIAEICRRLGGNPLALELAAARTNVLSLEQINERLHDLLGFLTDGKRTAAPRQQTLKAAIDWSYSLLSEKEQLLLRLLSVFRGEFTLDAVEEVCVYVPRNQEPCALTKNEILDLISKLVNKSLVTVRGISSNRMTYTLLASIKQYAEEKLEQCQLECERIHGADKEHIYRLHAEYYTRFIENMEVEWKNGEALSSLLKIKAEYDNLRAAMQWAYQVGDSDGLGLRIAASLYEFWLQEGNWREGLLWLSRLLPSANVDEDEVIKKALKGKEVLTRVKDRKNGTVAVSE